MNFVIAALIPNFSDAQAYQIFKTLIIDYRLRGLFEEGFSLLHLFFYQIDLYLQYYLPEVHNHLK